MAGRGLEPGDIFVINQVFRKSLPNEFLRSKVMLRNTLGIGDRPFTEISAGIGRYEIHMGWEVTSRTTRSDDYYSTLVHEMTHVWQARHSWWGIAGVWMSSIKCQCCRQGNAYLYGEGNLGKKEWSDFGREEQAQIVEDWYAKKKMKTTDPRFQYIRDNIWAGNDD